jgi:hypothetical protein
MTSGLVAALGSAVAIFRRRAKGKGISLLVPFSADTPARAATWAWLRAYWAAQIPAAQVIVQGDGHVPFSKTTAVNAAFRQSSGDVIVILDADCYLPGSVILDCARRIRRARRLRMKLWFVPYRHFYRLTKEASGRVTGSDPRKPYGFPTPPAPDDTEPATGQSVGHWFGALIQVMPREAFFAANGMDERFAGWGGEDVSFMRAVDTLYGKHRTTRNQVLHLWHPAHRSGGPRNAANRWEGQERDNNNLASKYTGANGRPGRMRALTIEEGAGAINNRDIRRLEEAICRDALSPPAAYEPVPVPDKLPARGADLPPVLAFRVRVRVGDGIAADRAPVLG